MNMEIKDFDFPVRGLQSLLCAVCVVTLVLLSRSDEMKSGMVLKQRPVK